MDKAALDKITYGLFVSGIEDENWFGGCLVDAFMQVTLVPPTAIYSSMQKNRTSELLKPGVRFSMSVLPEDVSPFVICNFGFQSSRNLDKWANVPHQMISGLPVLEDIAAYYICEVIDVKDLQTHLLVHCSVLEAEQTEKRPFIYATYREELKEQTTKMFLEYRKTGISPLINNEPTKET